MGFVSPRLIPSPQRPPQSILSDVPVESPHGPALETDFPYSHVECRNPDRLYLILGVDRAAESAKLKACAMRDALLANQLRQRAVHETGALLTERYADCGVVAYLIQLSFE